MNDRGEKNILYIVAVVMALIATLVALRQKLAMRLKVQAEEEVKESEQVLDPGIRIELGEEVFDPQPEETVFIPRGTVHRLSCVGENPARILEVSFGVFDEDDIVRLEDAYGRR
jgi:hypothetical protein